MPSVEEPVSGNPSTHAPALDLPDIQATILRPRPMPYLGTHVLLRIDDARAGREFFRRLTPHVDSAAGWWNSATPWLSVGITYAGLEALRLPKDSLHSFPEAFRVGMAARGRQLGDEGVNDPKNWDVPFGTGHVHVGWVRIQPFRGTAAPNPRDRSRAIRELVGPQRVARRGLRRARQSHGLPRRHRSAGDRGQRRRPAAGAGTADQGRRVHPGISGGGGGAPADAAAGRTRPNGTYVGLRKYQTRVGAFNRFLRANGRTEAERELLAAKLVGRWRSGAPLTLAPDVDNPGLGADPQRNNDFDYSNDRRGRQVPFGSHIRRMNPRDTELTRLTDVNLHRVIRRGTTYGPLYDPNAVSEEDDTVPRGVYFLFISAKVMATIEFLQQEWINDGNFIGAGRRARPDHRAAGGWSDVHHSEGASAASRPRNRDVQRPSRRGVLLHAEPVRSEMARRARMR